MRSAFILAAAAAAFLSVSVPAGAVTLGFELSVDGRARMGPGSLNVPLFTLTNTSSRARIAAVEVTVGDTGRSFDGVVGIEGPAGGSARLTVGDTGIARVDGVATDAIALAFEGFDPGESARWAADIDRDDGRFHEDFRRVMFSNGGRGNATVSVRFDDWAGSILSLTLPDLAADWRYYDFAASMAEPVRALRASFAAPAVEAVAAVPLPPSVAFLAGAVGGLGWIARRKRRLTSP